MLAPSFVTPMTNHHPADVTDSLRGAGSLEEIDMLGRTRNPAVLSSEDARAGQPWTPPPGHATGGRSAVRSLHVFAYWACTAVIAWEMAAGSLWDLLRIEYVRDVFDHLGYPHYLLLIIGAWKLPCAVALFVPRFARLKEWAYAGAMFNYTGAAASHFLVGDRASRWITPAIFGAVTLASWALRPPERRAPRVPTAGPPRPIAWIIPIVAIGAILLLALLTLPKGPPPS